MINFCSDRTIFIDLERLYFELESAVRGNRDGLKRKNEKKIGTDEALHKAAVSFLLQRLHIDAEECTFPDFSAE